MGVDYEVGEGGRTMSDGLEAFLTGEVDYQTFSVDSLSSASNAIKRLSVAQRKIDAIKEEAEAEVRKIAEWVERATKGPQQDVTFFSESLKAWMLRVREETGEKSVELPDGSIHSRELKAKPQVQDKELLIKWAQNNGREAWLREKLEVNLEALKDDVTIDGDLVVDSLTGEIVEGVVVVEADISVKIYVTGAS